MNAITRLGFDPKELMQSLVRRGKVKLSPPTITVGRPKVLPHGYTQTAAYRTMKTRERRARLKQCNSPQP